MRSKWNISEKLIYFSSSIEIGHIIESMTHEWQTDSPYTHLLLTRVLVIDEFESFFFPSESLPIVIFAPGEIMTEELGIEIGRWRRLSSSVASDGEWFDDSSIIWIGVSDERSCIEETVEQQRRRHGIKQARKSEIDLGYLPIFDDISSQQQIAEDQIDIYLKKLQINPCKV